MARSRASLIPNLYFTAPSLPVMAAIGVGAFLLYRQRAGDASAETPASTTTPPVTTDPYQRPWNSSCALDRLDSRLKQVYGAADPITVARSLGIAVSGDRVRVLVRLGTGASTATGVSMTEQRIGAGYVSGLVQPYDFCALANAAGVTLVEPDLILSTPGGEAVGGM